jgi:hypothetical protein
MLSSDFVVFRLDFGLVAKDWAAVWRTGRWLVCWQALRTSFGRASDA